MGSSTSQPDNAQDLFGQPPGDCSPQQAPSRGKQKAVPQQARSIAGNAAAKGPFGIEDWQRIFEGFTFLRIFSYTALWFIGKNRKHSIGLYSFGLISQECKQEV